MTTECVEGAERLHPCRQDALGQFQIGGLVDVDGGFGDRQFDMLDDAAGFARRSGGAGEPGA